MTTLKTQLTPLLLLLGLSGAANALPLTAPAGGQAGLVRQPAEFEPLKGVMVTFPLLVPVELIAEMAESDTVVTVVKNAAGENAARALYTANSVNLAHCTFLVHQYESHWTRDYGPWFAFDAAQQPRVMDFVYEWANSPGDDGTPGAYAQSEGLPSMFLDLVTAGGNYMTDGQGTSMACDNFLYLNNPGKSLGEIDTIFSQGLGLTRNHYLPDPGPYWWHVDCYAKFLDQDTIMVAQVDQGHQAYQQLEDTVSYLEQQISCWGTPYEVVRVYVPSGLYYSNALILNGKVLVPIDGGLSTDADALNTYRDAMPGYEVIGFQSLTGAWPEKWVSHDALHCRTKELSDMEMLYIGHQPLLDRPSEAGGFHIVTDVIAHSGQPILHGAPQLLWRTSGAFQRILMSPIGGDQFEAWIPLQPVGTTVEYFIHAEDGSGRKENHPYVGAAAAHSFTVTALGTDVSALSVQSVSTVEFLLDAGPANAGRPYFLLGSGGGTSPGIDLPGGLNLPLNRDAFMNDVRSNANSARFQNFAGTLDANGRAVALMDLSSGLPVAAGDSLNFAFLCYGPFDFVSNEIEIQVMD